MVYDDYELGINTKARNRRWTKTHTAHVFAKAQTYSRCGYISREHKAIVTCPLEDLPPMTTVCERCVSNWPSIRSYIYKPR